MSEFLGLEAARGPFPEGAISPPTECAASPPSDDTKTLSPSLALGPSTSPASPSSPSNKVVLDHDMLPHIMDKIIAAASRKTLMVLNRTSSDMWIHVAPYLPTHVRVSLCPVDKSTLIINNRGGIARARARPTTFTNAGDLPKWSFEWTRILDLHGPVDVAQFPKLRDAFTAVHTVRLNAEVNPYRPCPIPVKKLIFAATPGYVIRTSKWPPLIEEVVYNIRYSATTVMGSYLYANPLPFPMLSKFIIIFTLKNDSPDNTESKGGAKVHSDRSRSTSTLTQFTSPSPPHPLVWL